MTYKLNLNLTAQELSDDFIYWAYAQYHKIDYAPEGGFYANENHRQSVKKEQLEKLYNLGYKVFQIINCSFSEFQDSLINRRGIYPGYRDWKLIKDNSYPWYDHHGTYFRYPLKFQKKPHHKKKEKNSIKEDWRKKKGFERDYRRKSRGSFGKRKKFAKKISNKSFRQNTRALLEKNKFDEFFSRTPKHFFDPWMWD